MCSNVNPKVKTTIEKYLKQRKRILQQESDLCLNNELEQLSQKEKVLNEALLKAKLNELDEARQDSSKFLPCQHFFQAKSKIEQSEVFKILKKMPKGASLHTHLLAAVSADFIVENFTYKENLYGGFLNDVFKLRFMKNHDENPSVWRKISDLRKEKPNFDGWLRTQITLNVENPTETYPTAEKVWKKFKGTFTTLYDLISYKEVFEEYIYQLLKELQEDNVMYAELRGTIMPLYDLNALYSKEDFFGTFIKAVDNFKQQNPSFKGARYIHSVYRGVSKEVFEKDVEEIVKLKKLFPDFIAGLDFVGHEEEGNPIFFYREQLLEAASNGLKFFFHSGETNRFENNVVDAVLLDAVRIGHGLALAKHPVVAELAKKKNVAVELCPVSNQVLKLVDDPRNHPTVNLMTRGFPVVVCNDDPSAWGATGLSYDWYVVYAAMTSPTADLRVLKGFAVNSVKHSAMEEEEKVECLREWARSWDAFLNEFGKF